MPRKALEINTTTGTITRTPDLVESSEVQTTSTSNGIPRANTSGKIDSAWVPLLPLSVLPVASSGENSETKLVRADDSRLGNPNVGGDLSGTAGSATVIRIQGRVVANIEPSDGQGLVWNNTNNRWEPGTVGGSGGDGNATQIQGRDVAATAPDVGETLVWNGTAWSPGAGGGSAGALPEHVLIAASVWLHDRGPFG